MSTELSADRGADPQRYSGQPFDLPIPGKERKGEQDKNKNERKAFQGELGTGIKACWEIESLPVIKLVRSWLVSQE